ncbi:ABC transporter substrate-binding protein [Clostridium paraputrificum]|uniref:ABC transporter substrate-binding protein n=1 Tax=Clostridium paraputrificum TaxID=29363 RepID=UPI003D33B2E6
MRKKLVSIILGLIMVVVLVGCVDKNENGDTGNKVVRIGYPGTQNFIGGVAGIAQEKQFIEEELKKVGYRVEYKSFAAAGPAVNEALTAKEIDIAVYADFPGILSKSKGVETTLIGISDNYINSAVVVKSDSNISTIKDLKGKKIGFTKGTYMQKYLYQILEYNSIGKNEVELINTSDGEAALQGGTIDALVTTDTQEALLVLTKKQAKVIDTSKDHKEICAQSIIIGTNEFLEGNKEAVIALQRALLDAKRFIKDNTNESYEVFTKSGLDKESVEYLYGKDKEKFDYITLKVGEEEKKKLNNSKKFMLENKIISKDFDIDRWVDNSFYEAANLN